MVRRGVRELIDAEDDLEVVGEAGAAEQALARVPAARPDVAVLDVRLPDGTGVEVRIRSAHPDIACIMLTSFSDDEALMQAVMASVRIPAEADPWNRHHRRHPLGRRRRVPPRSGARPPGGRPPAPEPEEDERLARLTNQERRILRLIAEGLTNRQIAEQIHLAEKTVKNYVSNLLAKLGMERRTRGAVFAARLEQDADRST